MLRRRMLTAPLLLPGLRARAAAALHVVASFSVLADMVRQIVGDQAIVDEIVAIGGDVHEYEARPGDLDKIARAGLIVVNGLGLDRWIGRLIVASGSSALVVVAGCQVSPRQLPGGVTDPHAWQNPQNGILYAKAIEAAVLQAPGVDRAAIARQAQGYIAAIGALDRWCATEFATIPLSRRQIVTSHDAFGYYSARYGLTIHPVRGVENAEPSAAEFAALITRLRQQKGSVVFLENMTNPALLQSLAQETGTLIGGSLYADSLSAPGGPAATYIDMIRYNTLTIVHALRSGG